MKLHFIFHFIQTAEQEEEGLWIGLFFVIALIVLGIWAQLQPEEETYDVQNVRYFLENDPVYPLSLESHYNALICRVEQTNPTLGKQARTKYNELTLRAYLDRELEALDTSQREQFASLISLVEPTNPTLADQARKKYQDYKDDEIVVTFEVDVTEGNLKKKRSRRISQDVKDKVWRRDEGKCVECSSNENLEFDHIIPHSKGGANTYRNIQLLCEKCNRSKSAKIG